MIASHYKRQHSREGIGTARKALLALMAALLFLLTLALVMPAQAAHIEPPAAPKEPVIFPERDFVVAEGYAPNTELTIKVIRNGVTVGTARGTTDATGFTEVNHPGGVCWQDVTPDILPGDEVQIIGPGGATDTLATLDVTAEAAYIENGKLIVKGSARGEDGNAMSPDEFSRIEQRIINPDFDETEVGRRDISITSTGDFRLPAGASATFVRDADNPANWTVTYTGLSQNVMDLALAGQTRALSWMGTDANANRLGITIFEVG